MLPIFFNQITYICTYLATLVAIIFLGDALFFHCNLLHRSDQNHSDLRRWVMITSFNQKKNNPKIQHHHPLYHPLKIVENDAILKSDPLVNSKIDKDFMDPKSDVSAKKWTQISGIIKLALATNDRRVKGHIFGQLFAKMEKIYEILFSCFIAFFPNFVLKIF